MTTITSSCLYVSLAMIHPPCETSCAVAFVQIQTVFGGADGSVWMPAVWTAIEPGFIGAHAALFGAIGLGLSLAARRAG